MNAGPGRRTTATELDGDGGALGRETAAKPVSTAPERAAGSAGTRVAYAPAMKQDTARNGEEARPNTEAHRSFLRELFRELSAAERSARRDALREAARLGSAPAGEALRSIAAHAEQALREIGELARRGRLRSRRVRAVLGESMAVARELVSNRLVDAEHSYRATLLGLRQGMDLVDLTRRVADASSELEIGGFCTRWLEQRGPLVEQVAHGLAWFAHHPQRAVQIPPPRVVARLLAAGRRRPHLRSQAHEAR